MDINLFTQKSREALNDIEQIAMENGNQEMVQAHLLLALLQQEDGLIPKMIEKMEINLPYFTNAVQKIIDGRPKVSGGKRYWSQKLNDAVLSAEKELKVFGDEYVSVEHIMLSLIAHPDKEIKALFTEFGITRERFLQALQAVRGNQRVVSDNPEATYDTLEKYGVELVDRARDQKMDPVIGRDEEIRNVIRILSRKTKNNPVLIGEPGVGKTAVVEGLAQRIALGDVLVVLFFGIVPVCITYYIQLHTCSWQVFTASLACGAVVDCLLLVNNYRDRDNDKRDGKRTLVVEIGAENTERLYLLMGVAATLAGLVFWLNGHVLAFVLPLLYLVAHVLTWQKMRRINAGRQLNECLAETARNMLIYGLLVSLGIVLI